MEEEDQPQEHSDPMKFMEMQAQYLRMLAQYYDSEGGSAAQPEGAAMPVRVADEAEEASNHSFSGQDTPRLDQEVEESKQEEPAPSEDYKPPSQFVRSQSHDELPIRGLPKSFEESLEAEMLKTSKKSSLDPSPRTNLPQRPSKKHISSSPPTPSYRKKDQNEGAEEDTPRPQKAFLKRGQGQLCLRTSSMKSTGDREKDSAGMDIEKPEQEPPGDAGLSFSEDSKESTPDEDSLSYREEVTRLTSTLKELQREQLRLKGDKDRRDRKMKELEVLKSDLIREKQALIKEFEDWKAAESAKLRKERKQAEGGQRISKAKREEVEKLKAVVKKLEEEAKAREARHKQQIAKLQAELQEVKASRTSIQEANPAPAIDDSQSEASKPGDSVPVSKTVGADGKIITVHSDGKKEIQFPNGVRKEVYPDDFTVIYFTNNDIKQTFPDGKIVYYFADAQTTQTTFPDGLQIFKFANGQSEKHCIDNTKEITFPDGTVKCIFPDGEEESIFPDGTVQKVDINGVKYIDFVNGQKDTIYPDGTKVREFSDGRIKKILPNGKVVET